jgi:Tol biopolymer transport system component
MSSPTPTIDLRGPDQISPEAKIKIDPLLLEQMFDSNTTTSYFVWMAEKADLRPANQLKTKEAKGLFVLNALRQTADRTQRSLRRILYEKRVNYKPFYIANKIFVRDGDIALLQEIATRSDVARITRNRKFQLEQPSINPSSNPSSPSNLAIVEQYIRFINADQVRALEYDGTGITLAGNDTGLDWEHPSLINQYRGSKSDHNYHWWDATGTYTDAPSDGHGHGTYTTIIMVGRDDNGNPIGVAPGAKTIHCKNMDDSGNGDEFTFTRCFEWDLAPWDLSSYDRRPELAPDAISNPWGSRDVGDAIFEDEFAALHAAGIMVGSPAGNAGAQCTSLNAPLATGVIALLWSADPSLRGQVDKTTEIITHSSVPLSDKAGQDCLDASIQRVQDLSFSVSVSEGGRVVSDPAGIDCPGVCAADFPIGTGITLTAVPESQSQFDSWDGICSGQQNLCTFDLISPEVLNARFTLEGTISVDVSEGGRVVSDPAGIDCPGVCAADFPIGTGITLTAVPESQSQFDSWDGICSGQQNLCTFDLTSPEVLNARFTLEGTISVDVSEGGRVVSDPAGIDCPGVCTADFPNGSQVTVTATPAAGYNFKGWSGACSGTGPCVVTMDRSKAVKATFEAIISQGKLAFASDRDGNGEIYVMDPEGSNLVRLTYNNSNDWDPSWSPDGNRIAFVSARDGPVDIYVMDADGSNVVRLTNRLSDDWQPSWSPDGSKIVFTDVENSNWEIYTVDADGSNVVRLTNNPSEDWEPSWSPDGSKIAFISRRGGNGTREIYVMNADGSNVVRLTKDAFAYFKPSWSPDGSRIVFTSTEANNWDIYTMNIDGSGFVRLTSHPSDDWEPSWSSDGSKIAFTSIRDGNEEIYIMDSDGSNLVRLTNNSYADRTPSWSRP